MSSMNKEKEMARKQQDMLMTSSMRENAALQEKRTYNYSLVRIRLPDSSFLEVQSSKNQIRSNILQGTFTVYEKASEIVEFMKSYLTETLREFDIPFELKTNDRKVTLLSSESCDKTLKELGLYPGKLELLFLHSVAI